MIKQHFFLSYMVLLLPIALFCGSCVFKIKPLAKNYAVSDDKLTLVTSPFVVEKRSLFTTFSQKYIRLLVCKKTTKLTEKMLTDSQHCRPALVAHKYAHSIRERDKQTKKAIGKQEVVFVNSPCVPDSLFTNTCDAHIIGKFFPVPISDLNISTSTAKELGLVENILTNENNNTTKSITEVFGAERFNQYVTYYFSVTKQYDSFFAGQKMSVESLGNLIKARREAVSFLELTTEIRLAEMKIYLANKLKSMPLEQQKIFLQRLAEFSVDSDTLQASLLEKKKAHTAITTSIFSMLGSEHEAKRKEAEHIEITYVQELISSIPKQVISAVATMFKVGVIESKLTEIDTNLKELMATLSEKEKERKYFHQWKKEDIEADKIKGNPTLEVISSVSNSMKKSAATNDVAKVLFNHHSPCR